MYNYLAKGFFEAKGLDVDVAFSVVVFDDELFFLPFFTSAIVAFLLEMSWEQISTVRPTE